MSQILMYKNGKLNEYELELPGTRKRLQKTGISVSPDASIGNKVRLESGVNIAAFARVDDLATLSFKVQVGAGSYIGRRAWLGDFSKTGSNTIVRNYARLAPNTVLLDNTWVPAGISIDNENKKFLKENTMKISSKDIMDLRIEFEKLLDKFLLQSSNKLLILPKEKETTTEELLNKVLDLLEKKNREAEL